MDGNMTDTAKLLMVVLIFVVWGSFVYLGLAPASDYIQALRDGLIGLGVFQATVTFPRNQ